MSKSLSSHEISVLTPPSLCLHPYSRLLPSQIASYAHLHPGMPLSVSVTGIEDYGLLVTAGPGLKGLVPRLHASDLGTAKALLKFKVRLPPPVFS